jgi:hypothetical protein
MWGREPPILLASSHLVSFYLPPGRLELLSRRLWLEAGWRLSVLLSPIRVAWCGVNSWIASSRITFELELSPSNNGDWSPQISLTDQLRTYHFSNFGVLLAGLLYRQSSPSQLSTLGRSSNQVGHAGCRRLMPQLSNKESTMRPIFPTMLPVQTTVIGVHRP